MRNFLIACTTIAAAGVSFAVASPAQASAGGAAAAVEDGCGIGSARNSNGYCERTGRGSNCPTDHFRTLAGNCERVRGAYKPSMHRGDVPRVGRSCGRGYFRNSGGYCQKVRYRQPVSRGSNCPPNHFRTLAGYCQRVRN